MDSMLEDLSKGEILHPSYPAGAALGNLIGHGQPIYFSYQDWMRLDELEVSRGRD
ncbi:MAG: hypothetical protein ACE5NC_09020 [Anaerolineae bacterium]